MTYTLAMDKRYVLGNPIIHYSVLFFFGAIIIAAFASHTLFHVFFANAANHTHGTAIIQPCPTTPPHVVRVDIAKNKFVPSTIVARRCDQLIITNLDNVAREPALGPHEHHIAYPGLTEKTLNEGQSNSFILYQTGSFLVHDHDDDTVVATLVIK